METKSQVNQYSLEYISGYIFNLHQRVRDLENEMKKTQEECLELKNLFLGSSCIK